MLESERGDEWMVGAKHDGRGACVCEFDEFGDPLLEEECPALAHGVCYDRFDRAFFLQQWVTRECPAVAHTGAAGAGILAVAFSPCMHPQRFATGGGDGAVIVWDAQTGKAEIRMHSPEQVNAVSFSADGARLASGRGRTSYSSHAAGGVPIEESNQFHGCVDVFDVTTGTLLHTFPQAGRFGVLEVDFSPAENHLLASASADIVLWDVDRGEEKSNFPSGMSFLKFSPDGRTIATASRPNAPSGLVLLDSETGEIRCTMVGHEAIVLRASFSVNPQP